MRRRGPSGPGTGGIGTSCSTPPRSRSPRTAASSRGGSGTSWGTGPAGRGGRRGGREAGVPVVVEVLDVDRRVEELHGRAAEGLAVRPRLRGRGRTGGLAGLARLGGRHGPRGP